VQHTRKWRQSGRESLVDHEVGLASSMVRSLCELEWGKGERIGAGFARRGGGRATVPKRREGWGSSMGMRARVEGWHDAWKRRGQYASEASVAHRCSHARAAHVGPTTNGVHRARDDNDPACQAHHRNDIKSGASITPTYMRTNFSCRSPLSSKTMLTLLPWKSTLHQPIVDFPFEHKDIFTKGNICSKSGIAM
jgi:hypothetical protein